MSQRVGDFPLKEALPHRPPMVWIDEVLSAGADGGVCAVDLRPDQLYAGADGLCLEFAVVEWIAQAYGYSRASHAFAGSIGASPLKRAYLVGVGQLDLKERIPVRGRILIEARTSREMAPLALVKGQVRDASGKVFAEAQLKLYFE